VADYTLPHDTETERLLLGVRLIETPEQRSVIIRAVRPGWFFDPWHRDTFDAIRAHRDLDGRELCAAILTDAHRLRWDNPALYLGLLLETREGHSVCGQCRSWRLYAAQLERVADARDAILFLADKLTEATHAGRNLISESRTERPQLRCVSPGREATATRDRACAH
jgi:hypothetical protein